MQILKLIKMSTEEIKSECDICYKQIKKNEDRLKELRSICKHENTFEGDYSYREGSILPAVICSDCGSLIRFNFDYIINDGKSKYFKK